MAWATSRALVIVLAVAASLAFGVPERGVNPAVPHALAMLGGWDTTWYLDVARHGYAHDTGQVGEVFTNLAFFPLLPGVMAAALAIGLNPFITALVVSNLAFLAALQGVPRPQRRALRRGGGGPGDVGARPAPHRGLRVAGLHRGHRPGVRASRAALAGTRGRYAAAGPARRRRDAWPGPPGGSGRAAGGLLALRGPAPGRARRVALAVGPEHRGPRRRSSAWMAVARGSALLPFEAQRAWDRGQLGIGLVTAAPREISGRMGPVSRGDRRGRLARHHPRPRSSSRLPLAAGPAWRSAREACARPGWPTRRPSSVMPLSSGTITSMARFGLMAFPLMWPLGDWIGAEPRRARWAAAAAVVLIVLLVAQLEMRSPWEREGERPRPGRGPRGGPAG